MDLRHLQILERGGGSNSIKHVQERGPSAVITPGARLEPGCLVQSNALAVDLGRGCEGSSGRAGVTFQNGLNEKVAAPGRAVEAMDGEDIFTGT